MNDYRKIANYVRKNGLVIKPFETQGTAGGFDDQKGFTIHKGPFAVGRIVTEQFNKEKFDPVAFLKQLQKEVDDLETIEVIDEESLVDYLKKNHSV